MSSDSDDSLSRQEGPQEQWSDWEEGDAEEEARSLFSDAVYPSVPAALAADAASHGFDLRQYVLQENLDQYGAMRVINFIRRQVAAGADPLPALRACTRPWASDEYLSPALPADAYLFHDWDEEAALAAGAAGAPADAAGGGAAAAEPQGEAGGSEEAGAALRALRAENEALRDALAELALENATPALRQLLQEGDGGAVAAVAAEPSASAAAAAPNEAGAEDSAARIDGNYFDSYSFFDIHREMLSDKVRTESYRTALERNPSLVRGAAVLDVGCGTGVLSMFAARGGARAVVGVDGSERIARFARANAAANGLLAPDVAPDDAPDPAAANTGGQAGASGQAGGKGVIRIVSGKVEDLQQLPAGLVKADVLVSEWMGYALLFESMLGSVLDARDRLLVPGGAVLPDVATLHVAAAGPGATGLAFWKDVYGLSMAPVAESLHQSALKEALVRSVAPSDLLSEGVLLHTLDLATMAPADQDFSAGFRLEFGAGPAECAALVLWFDAEFSARYCRDTPVTLSTSPYEPPTHWVQAVLALREPVTVAPAAAGVPGAAAALRGTLTFSRARDRHRGLDLVLQAVAVGADGRERDAGTTAYRMGVSEG